MNTKDIGNSDAKKYPGDKLDQIFAAQQELMIPYKEIAEGHYSKIFGMDVKFSDELWKGGAHNLQTKAGNYIIRDMINACCQELNEAIQTTKNWKAWKQTEVRTDEEHFREEIIDAVHFLVEALIFAGMTSEDVYNIYFKKNKVNQFRQTSKY